MNIIAIDPGPEESGLVCFDGARIMQHAILPNAEILSSLTALCSAKIPKLFVGEMIASYGMAVGREVFETCLFLGRCVQVAAQEGAKWRLLYRLDVKRNVCHDTRAKDSNIRQALIDRFGKPGTKKAPGGTYGLAGDEWSAFALAVTAWDLMNEELPFDPLTPARAGTATPCRSDVPSV